MENLWPDIKRALERGSLDPETMTLAYWYGFTAQMREPCLLLGRGGRVLRATLEMDSLLAAEDGLACVSGRLTANSKTAAESVVRFVEVLATGERRPRVCRIDRQSGKAPYVLTGYPLTSAAAIILPLDTLAIVTVIDPATIPAMSVDRWHSAYGLTQRELALAQLMVMGHSLETAATNLGISIGTARVHLRHVFAKTGTTRQVELVRLLTRIGG